MDDIKAMVDALSAGNDKYACQCTGRLIAQSELSPDVYRYFDVFASLLSAKSSFSRTRGFTLIAANARWDSECKTESILEPLLARITDEKPITSRQCIKALPMLALYKPALRPRIMQALATADTSAYSDSMRPLVMKDIEAAMSAITKLA